MAAEPLPEGTWRALAAAQRRRAEALTGAHLERRARGLRHPVEDFLYSYYPVRPAQLRRWCPGPGVALAGAADPDGAPDPALAHRRWLRADGDRVRVDAAGFRAARGAQVRAALALLRATAGRTGRFGCFGLHEWAMVYREPDPRHPDPLRLGAAGTDAVVESHRIRCGHYDAFRFFTAAARERNSLRPTAADRAGFEQPGCLHANMDLLKWALKLGPLVESGLLLDAFELARDIRYLDMAASPYDLRAWGLDPVPVETDAGKAAYVTAQRGFAERAEPIRARLIAAAEAALADGAEAPGRTDMLDKAGPAGVPAVIDAAGSGA